MQTATISLDAHGVRVAPVGVQERKVKGILSFRQQSWYTVAATEEVKVARHQGLDQLAQSPFRIMQFLCRPAATSPREVWRSPDRLRRLGSQPCRQHSGQVCQPSVLVNPEMGYSNCLGAHSGTELPRC